ncbi:hypothetical protein [Streptomyces melanogenes]|uniref:hypothetical protein n=1 Tax=Streptomyces melanogenes TaxID=67326 RepID=UPI00167DE4D8|nr:hypothetical protein [Streptomyces melanogenes]GGP72222.1 hypothetical protein GCM10010278_57890 [Streptomyces melanogenes]
MTQINPEIINTARKAAAKLHRENSYCEADDIEQYILLKYWECKTRFDSYEPRALYTVFQGIGVEHCKAERLHYTYNTAAWIYTPKEVRNVLQHAYYREEAREIIPNRKDDLMRVANDPTSIALSIWDIDEAMGRLSDAHQAAIERAFLHEEKPSHGSAEHKQLQRAIDRLTERLNSKTDQRGRERAAAQGNAGRMGSAAATAAADTTYHGTGGASMAYVITERIGA